MALAPGRLGVSTGLTVVDLSLLLERAYAARGVEPVTFRKEILLCLPQSFLVRVPLGLPPLAFRGLVDNSRGREPTSELDWLDRQDRAVNRAEFFGDLAVLAR
jgi:hypothetical protein